MAQLTIDIDDVHLPRIKEAMIPFLQEGDAVDLLNPTNAEVAAKLKVVLITKIKQVVSDYEKATYINSYVMEVMAIS